MKWESLKVQNEAIEGKERFYKIVKSNNNINIIVITVIARKFM